MKPSVWIRDSFFTFHQESGITGSEPNYFTWYTGEEPRDVCFFTGSCLPMVLESPAKIKVAWMVEPYIDNWHREQWDFVLSHLDVFDYVLTYMRRFIDGEKILFVPCAGTFIEPQDRKIPLKNKLCSMLFSDKDFLEGHKLRHEVAHRINSVSGIAESVKFYGAGANLLDDRSNNICSRGNTPKIDALRDFMFSIVVMPVKVDDMWNEQIIDCFLTGTIPVYWGTRSILDTFDPDGVICFDNLDHLMSLFESGDVISPRLYWQRLRSIRRNFLIAQEYIYAEDFMWKKYPFLFTEVLNG